MSGGTLSTEMGASPSIPLQINKQSDFSSHILQASHMIVSYDEHDVKNTFKFGVIYQKAKQVSTTSPYWSLYPVGSHWGLHCFPQVPEPYTMFLNILNTMILSMI